MEYRNQIHLEKINIYEVLFVWEQLNLRASLTIVAIHNTVWLSLNFLNCQ